MGSSAMDGNKIWFRLRRVWIFVANTMGRSGDSNRAASTDPRSNSERTASSPSAPVMGNNTASGLWGLGFRARRRRMAASLRASQKR